jgi:C4-dicarboxylate-specific signal transduction histidine kinase
VAESAKDKHRFELAHAARLAVAGELTASIAHEINQPLGAIQSNVAAAAMILDNGASRDELQQILEDIRRDNLRASHVIVQLRKLFDKHEVERRIVALGGALADMEMVLRAEALRRRVDLRTAVEDPDASVLGDRVQIQQVLINLVLNAMDAVAGQPDGRRQITVTLSSMRGTASIEVADTGRGIDGAHLARLFDSFFSTKPSGIGLGLSIVRTIVEAHGGTVQAQNRPSGGAAFRVELPVAVDPAKLEVA